MQPRERVLMAMRREGIPDRMPFEISWGAFTPAIMEKYHNITGAALPPEEYFDFDVRTVGVAPSIKHRNISIYFDEALPEDAVFDEFGAGGVRGSQDHFLEFRYHPLAKARTVEDIRAYQWPDLDADYRYEGLKEQVKVYHDRGYAVTGDMYSTIFETAWMLRGLEQLLIDFYEEPELIHELCEQITSLRITQAQKYAQTGVDIIRLGDDVATQLAPMISPCLYREFFQSRMKRIVDAGKNINPTVLYFLHSCGKVESMIPYFLEEGIDILNPVQPECNDLEKIARLYGDKISFWGGIGTQTTMPFGTPDDVGEKVRHVQRILGKNGGLLIAPSHILEPEVPWENITAFIENAKKSYY
ncbi:uroporphyrinogen decarboxylase family protein [uncultured Robinsoniella sp.]|uniref:uroporphyrinogen decarboxylase family protein n=1 Tax=uncultured Robinsoniella sp. TaxID=904190 RepID=UPI00374ED529